MFFSYENIISRTCYYAWYVLTRRIDSNYPDVQKKVLGSELVQNAVHLAAQDEYKQINGALPGKSNLLNFTISLFELTEQGN